MAKSRIPKRRLQPRVPTEPVAHAQRSRARPAQRKPADGARASGTASTMLAAAAPDASTTFDELVVVDNLPIDIPIANRELDVIETHLNALLAEILGA